MKKLMMSIVIAGLSLLTYSCRETTQEKTEEAVEAIGEDIEAGTEKAAEEIEEGVEEVGRELDEEYHGTDDDTYREDLEEK